MEQTKLERIRHNLKNIALSSTTHGLPNVFRTQSKCLKIMWLFMFIVSTSFGVFLSFKSVFAYLDHEVITQIDVVYELPTQFPTVTFFNLRDSRAKIPLEDLLIECTFNDDVCTASDFDMVEDKFGYISYRFQSKESFTAGKINGLNLKLFYGLMQPFEQATDDYSRFDGYQIAIHNKTMDPSYYAGFAYDGIDVAPGFATNLVVNRVFTYKLEEPHNKCKKDLTNVDSFDSDIFKFMLTSTNYSYRQKDCFDYCIGREFNKQCNLTARIDHWINVWLFDKESSNHANNVTNTDCFMNVYYNLTRGNINKVCAPACPLECDSISYDVSVSFSKFPNPYYASRLFKNPIILSKFPKNRTITYDDLSKSMISFNVYYNDLKYTRISQIPKTKIVDLVSNMGGLFGLFIGISFISFAEILQVICEIVFILFENKKFKIFSK